MGRRWRSLILLAMLLPSVLNSADEGALHNVEKSKLKKRYDATKVNAFWNNFRKTYASDNSNSVR